MALLCNLLFAKGAKGRDASLDCIPNNFSIEHFVSVHKVAAHAVDAAPLDFRMRGDEFVR